VKLAPEWPKSTKIKNKYQNTPNYSNYTQGGHLYHPHRRFFFDTKFSALEDGFVDGRARTEPLCHLGGLRQV